MAINYLDFLRYYKMNFDDFIKEGKVILGNKDVQKTKALIKMSETNLKAVGLLPINDITASSVLSLSYESLREILEAMCLVEGYKVYSHEAFTSYLSKLKEDNIAVEFDRFRKLRNGVNYYGKTVSVDIALDSKDQIKLLCLKLKEKYLKKYE